MSSWQTISALVSLSKNTFTGDGYGTERIREADNQDRWKVLLEAEICS